MQLFWVFVICVLPRIFYLLVDRNAPLVQASVYWDLSGEILRSGSLGPYGGQTTRIEPLYPAFLALCRLVTADKLFGVMLFQIALCGAGCVFLYKLCELLSNKRTAAIAVLLFSFYPYLIRQQISLIEVSLVTTLLIMGAYFYSRMNGVKDLFYCAISFGLAVLARVALLPIGLLALGAVFFKKRLRDGFILLLISTVIILPFFLKNYFLDGSFLTSRAGYDLYKGNNLYSGQLLPSYSLDVLTPYLYSELEKEKPGLLNANENRIDRYFFGKAVQFAEQNKAKTLKLKLLNILYFFHLRVVPFHPFNLDSQFVVSKNGEIHVENVSARNPIAEGTHVLFYGFILLAALVGIILRRKEWRKDLILYFILASFTFVHSVYWPATRYRISMDFVLIFFAAFTVDRFFRKFAR